MSYWLRIQAAVFGTRFGWGLLALVLAWAAQAGLQMAHFFDHYDQADADHYARTTPVLGPYSERITIVAVDEDDYRTLFHSRSPLAAETVLGLVQAVQSYRPKVIGLDFLTADWSTRPPEEVLRSQPPIVWARDGREIPAATGDAELPSLIWNGVAGYPTPPEGLCFAVPANQPDSDGSVRRYSGAVEAREQNAPYGSLCPTMARVLASSLRDKEMDCRTAPREPSQRIRFTGEFHRFRILHASDVLNDAHDRKRFGKYLSGRIVLVGGTYAAARDRYASAGGYLNGLEILAHSTESEISGPVDEFSPPASLIISLVFSVLAYLVAIRLPSPWDFVFSVAVVVAYSFLTGWVLYRYVGVFAPIASTLLSLPIGVIFEHFVECRARQRRLDGAQRTDQPDREGAAKPA